MAQTALTKGPVHTLTQNISYALPPGQLRVRTSAAIESSLDESTWVALTLVDGQVLVAAPFIRTTAATALVQIAQT